MAFYTPWPVSFFITTFAFGSYVVVGAGHAVRRRLQLRSRRDAREPAAAPA